MDKCHLGPVRFGDVATRGWRIYIYIYTSFFFSSLSSLECICVKIIIPSECPIYRYIYIYIYLYIPSPVVPVTDRSSGISIGVHECANYCCAASLVVVGWQRQNSHWKYATDGQTTMVIMIIITTRAKLATTPRTRRFPALWRDHRPMRRCGSARDLWALCPRRRSCFRCKRVCYRWPGHVVNIRYNWKKSR